VVVERVARDLKKRSNDVFVISVGRHNKVEEIDGIRVYRIKPFNLFNFLDINNKPAWLRFPWHIIDMINDMQTWRIWRVIMKENPDLVLTHNLKGLGYYIPWVLRIMKINHIHTVHDMQLIHPSGLINVSGKVGIFSRIYAFVCKNLFKSPKTVVFPSQYIKGVYEKYGFFKKSNKIVLGNPVKMHGLIKKGKDACRSPQLLFLGQVEEYKGIFDLITAIKEIKSSITLHIVGDGKALERARELAGDSKKFKFHGRMDHDEIDDKIWPNINLLINPTHVPESFGMVVMEACSYGIPSLSSNVGAISELIDDGKTGWLFEAGNTNQLKDKLETISGKLCTYGAIGMLCQERAKKFETGMYLNKLMESVKIREL
jgi:glycosyltransferase involved in cell wall biosynthesis